MEIFPGVGNIAPLLLRNFFTSTIISADNSLLNLAEKYNLHQLYRLFRIFQKLFISSFLFFLGFLPSFFSFLALLLETVAFNFRTPKSDRYAPSSYSDATCNSGLERALTQLLILVNNVPVSSRKYDIVRSLAELLIDENHRQGFQALREVNRRVLSVAFERALDQLEAAASEIKCEGGFSGSGGSDEFGLGRVFMAVRGAGKVVLGRFIRRRAGRCENSSGKVAAELLWLAQKMAACGIVEEAVGRWASASNLASLGLSVDPRLQGSFVKISAFLVKQAKTMEGGESKNGKKGDEKTIRQAKMNMLMSWLPLLCQASNGTDAPVLSSSERAELERVLEETIESLSQDEQEKVLSLWLHHFSYCTNSDWPNLRAAFLRWCTASRKLVVLK